MRNAYAVGQISWWAAGTAQLDEAFVGLIGLASTSDVSLTNKLPRAFGRCGVRPVRRGTCRTGTRSEFNEYGDRILADTGFEEALIDLEIRVVA
jgi:hypothetical protein